MFISLITDCKDDNALGRSSTRLSTLFSCHISTVGVSGWDADLEAAGNLIDILDASNGQEGAILVNVAPRHQKGKKWSNGTPFAYFYYKNTLVVIAVDGMNLSLVKKLNIVDTVSLMDIPTVLKALKKQGVIDERLEQHITHTQFRSFEFLPRIAKWILNGFKIPSKSYSLKQIPDCPHSVWWIDNFGNVKTTLLEDDVDFAPGKRVQTKFGKLTCYSRLKDVPNNEAALIIGSSGLEDKRFLEIVIQGQSSAEKLQLRIGEILI